MALGSPFPGMDPYLERHWLDVHSDLVAQSRTYLNTVLPDDLVARMEERVVIDAVGHGTQRAIYPDVRVYEDPNRSAPSGAPQQGAATELMPIILEFEAEEHSETYVTIIDSEGGQLITVVEFLSPTNKLPGEGREQYRRERDELFRANVNIVEIDLVRQGSWREVLRPMVAPARVQTPYRLIAWRAHPKRQVELIPLSLRQPLPRIPVPLRAGDADVEIDLQQLITEAYRNGRYDHTDYNAPCDPPMDADDAAWADELLRTAGRRRTG